MAGASTTYQVCWQFNDNIASYSKLLATKMPLMSVRASSHQGCAFRFGNNAGFQCTAIPLAALIFAFFSPCLWIEFVHVGQYTYVWWRFYTSVVHSNYAGQQVYLMPADLPRQTECRGCRMSISYRLDELHGTTAQFIASDEEMHQSSSFLASPFDSALIAAFSTSDFSLLSIGQLQFAVFHDPIHNTYCTIHILVMHLATRVNKVQQYFSISLIYQKCYILY